MTRTKTEHPDLMPTIRLRTLRGRLLGLLSLSRLNAAHGYVREDLLIASPTWPRLRRLTVYRRLGGPPPRPDLPRAA
jgi:hypothetical protein